MGYSSTTVQGNLGADPELRYTQEGKAVCNFTVAVNLGQKRTDWYRVSAWEALAETCYKHLKKGQAVMVVGRMDQARAYLDRQGQPAAQLELTAQSVQFMSGGNGGDTTPPDELGDIPF